MTIKWRIIAKTTAVAGFTCTAFMLTSLSAFLVFDRYSPPPLAAPDVSIEVVDADGKLLRAFATRQGRWRFLAHLDAIDSEFIDLLIAYEDQRFWSHPGVDVRSMIRASWQFIANARIISGGSTITMQLARLIEPRKKRSIKSKLLQMVRALQIERLLTKKEILERYLMLAPYGGNLEGVRAASLAWFGKEPKGLSLAQAALLVALPQSPERRRPDRFAENAQHARDKVLARASRLGTIAPSEVARASVTPVSSKRFALPEFAPHLAQRALALTPNNNRHQTTLKRSIQQSLETVAREAVRGLDDSMSIAMILADARTGDILAEIGSPNYLDRLSSGWVDMTRALRSPGSALKPFIYGLALEEGLIKPETLVMDSPSNFAGYRPRNFDMKYQGEISVRRALQLSLNVPAVQLLEAVGPTRLISRFSRARVKTTVPRTERPGLAIGLGGIGISLRDLTQLYASLANDGQVSVLRDGLADSANSVRPVSRLLKADAAWHVTDILSGAPPPAGTSRQKFAYKTGTSYGYRDAWSVGYDGRHVLGVWVGRPDNGPAAGITGYTTAAPILFEAFSKSGLQPEPFAPAPAGALRLAHARLPVTLQRFASDYPNASTARTPEPAPQIIYPPNGASIELGTTATGAPLPLVMKLQDGRPPFRWLANGVLFSPGSRKRTVAWTPDGDGFSKLTVVDAGGRAASVNVYLKGS